MWQIELKKILMELFIIDDYKVKIIPKKLWIIIKIFGNQEIQSVNYLIDFIKNCIPINYCCFVNYKGKRDFNGR